MDNLLITAESSLLQGCDDEPIHVPGSIMPHGALVALDPRDLSIVAAGGATMGLIGCAAADLPGKGAESILSSSQIERLLGLFDPLRPLLRPVLAFSLDNRADGAVIDAIVHQSDGLLLLEFERRHGEEPADPLLLVQSMIHRAQRAEQAATFCAAVAAELREVTGFDRVMVYRFMNDGSGEVIAEQRTPAIESFLGQRFPESDIPSQARALYLANWIRLIPDARYAPALIIPPSGPDDSSPLDLSKSVLRSVSPVHRQYLANMGVDAAMSLSIVVGGRLWGLIACHHATPRHLPFRLRDACELFAEMTSAVLEKKVAAEGYEARLQATRIHEELVNRLAGESDLAEGLMHVRPNLRDFIPAAGVGLWIEGRFTGDGVTPPQEWIAQLVAWLNDNSAEGVFQTDCLPLLYPPAEPVADMASGILALSVSKSPRDYLIWFRPELIRTVTWAGDPGRKLAHASGGEVLTPRRSFEAWTQLVRLHAAPWQPTEIDVAHRLRVSLLEVVLRRIDQTARDREVARLQQARLTAELDQRVVQWQALAKALQQETERRAVAESELSQVLRRTVEDQEAERLRIARELHDTLGQSLTLLQLGLEAIGTGAPATPDLAKRVAALKALAADVGREANRLAWEIRPTSLDDLGIQTAIRNLLETWSEHSKIQFDLHMRLEERRLTPAVETTLYRVLQEALTNVVRHARASRVGVILRVADQQVTMIVEDDGRGFRWDDHSAADGKARQPSKRLGLLGMRERLALVGGSLEVESSPEEGTTLFVRVPV